MRPKHYWLLVACSLGLAACVKAAQVALTPEFYAALADAGTRLLASSGFGFLVAGTGCVFCLSLCAAAWERAQRRYERRTMPTGDTSSLMDDSPAPLPETWRAPCGEVVRFPDTPSDRGFTAPGDAA